MKIAVPKGASLEAVLGAAGVEFPCGGAGTCGGCRVRVLEGWLAVTPEMKPALTAAELDAGWRLACCSRAETDVVVEAGEWNMPVLSDDSAPAPSPGGRGSGIGIAVDLGTTTLVAQAVDLATGELLGVETALNPQAAHGADVMTRIEYALKGGAGELAAEIRGAIGRMVAGQRAALVLLAGNTAMHHLFCGVDAAPLAAVPFEPADLGEHVFAPAALGWDLPEEAEVRFLPCLGGFVGSDILAGIAATGMAHTHALQALIDLGTNGEIVVGNAERMLCASTAAGPAFEAGRIRMGMRAAPGAVSHVEWRDGAYRCRTVGDAAPRGICGSGLVDAVAAGLESGAILSTGRMPGKTLRLAGPVEIAQSDVRELQLAKGAIAAGLRILAERWGARVDQIERVYLAGAFGNYVRVESARRIGLLEVAAERIAPAGNTSLRGVKMALAGGAAALEGIRERTGHVPLGSDARFQETFAECLGFPE